jgi:hypothetical protein
MLQDEEAPVPQAHEVYSPTLHSVHEPFSVPMARPPLCNKKYIIQETPYLNNLHLALDRPVMYHNRLRHLLMLTCVEQLTLPVTLVSYIYCL